MMHRQTEHEQHKSKTWNNRRLQEVDIIQQGVGTLRSGMASLQAGPKISSSRPRNTTADDRWGT